MKWEILTVFINIDREIMTICKLETVKFDDFNVLVFCFFD